MVHFQLGQYDHDRELVIDPVFVFSTYLSGSNSDTATAVTTDAQGNVYVTGYTSSTDFPTVSPLQGTATSMGMAFVSKLDPTGQSLLYSTYLGGSSANYGYAVTLDTNGNIIVAGISSSNDFPHAGSVPTISCQINSNCYFLSSLKPDGSAFNYSGLVGGLVGFSAFTGHNGTGSLVVDSAGNAYLAGVTDDRNFELTPGTLASSVPGYPYDSTFVLKVSPSGALVYSTIVPGTSTPNPAVYLSNVFVPSGISVDANGQATIGGTAGTGLPTTAGVIQPTFPNNLNTANGSAGFVLQLNANASAVKYATYVPGTDTVGAFIADSSGNSYLTGMTSETTLPVSSNAYEKTIQPGQYCTCNSGFIVKLNPNATAVLAATYLEGTPASSNAGSNFTGIALDSNSNIFVGGMTGSTNFPMQNPFVSQWVYGFSVADMVLAEMSSDLSTLKFGSFLSSLDQTFPASQFYAITLDSQDNLVVAGQTSTTDFPTTPGAFQRTPPKQASHPFIAKLDMATAAPSVCFDQWSVDFGSVPAKQSTNKILNLTNCGNAPLSITSLNSSSSTVTVQNSCGAIQPGSTCALNLKFAPIDSSQLAGTLSFSDNAVISPQTVQVFGQGQGPALSPTSGTYDFGHLLVSTSGAPTPILFSNTGNAPLTITSPVVSGDFALSQNQCTSAVPPGFWCSVNITFTPQSAGQRNGTLTISSNDPVYAQATYTLTGTGDSVYASPQVTSLAAATAQINNGPIVIQVSGTNFYPASIVTANGLPQSTTYSSQQQLQATLSSSVTSTIDEIQIAVSTPSPGGGASTSIPLTLYNQLNVEAAFLATIPGSSTIYASVPSSATSNPNTVVPIDPLTGAVGTPIAVGHDPGLLAVSSDGNYLFVVLNQDQTVQRINLASGTVDRTFAFPPPPCSYCGPQGPADLEAVPANPTEVVLALQGEMALYNDQGLVNYIPTSSIGFSPTFDSFAFAGNPLTIYALPFTLVPNSFFSIVNFTAQGLSYTPITGTNFGGNNTTGAQVVSDGTLLYTFSGQVWDPSSQKQTGSFPVTAINAGSFPNLHSLTIDNSAAKLFLLGFSGATSQLEVSAYNKNNLSLSGTLAFPQVQDVLSKSLVRWGSNGLAFLGWPSSGPNLQVPYIFISSLAGPVSTPGIGLAPAPGSSTSATVAAGGSATYNLLIGGGGISGTAILTCSGAPQGVTCSLPATLNLNGSAPSPLTVDIHTTSRFASRVTLPRGSWAWAVFLFGFLVLPRPSRKRHAQWPTTACLLLLLGICSCGGGATGSNNQNTSGTPAGQYTLTVTAATGGLTQSVKLQLTVQ